MSTAADPEDPVVAPRDRILRAVLDLVAEHGIGALSHRQIAAHAGVSLGTLSYHFPDRPALLRESLRLFASEEVARIESVGRGLRSGEHGLDDLGGLVTQAMAGAADVAYVVAQFELYLHVTRDADLRDAVIECQRAYDDLAEEALRLLGVHDPEGIAPLVVSMADGLALRRVLSGDENSAMLTRAFLLIAAGARAEADARS
ncbi:MAG: TetR family transcriptional regulator [Patulibacter sp.]|nr:TetR family transcriptional regulator [Patulibacter sp.]